MAGRDRRQGKAGQGREGRAEGKGGQGRGGQGRVGKAGAGKERAYQLAHWHPSLHKRHCAQASKHTCTQGFAGSKLHTSYFKVTPNRIAHTNCFKVAPSRIAHMLKVARFPPLDFRLQRSSRHSNTNQALLNLAQARLHSACKLQCLELFKPCTSQTAFPRQASKPRTGALHKPWVFSNLALVRPHSTGKLQSLELESSKNHEFSRFSGRLNPKP